MFMVPRQFSTVIFTDDNASIFFARFFGFRFCVINHVSVPELLSLTSLTCPKVHTVLYNDLCHCLWDSLAPSVHALLCNPVGPRQFCALPSECLALWQCQQLNMSVRHTSSVVDMLGAKVTTCQHLSCHCRKPCTISACFHGITHKPYIFTKCQWLFTGATHVTHKNQNTSYFKVCHGWMDGWMDGFPEGRPSIFNLR